jgi:hypothetical protein
MLMPSLLIKIRHQHENVYSICIIYIIYLIILISILAGCSYELKSPKVLAYLRETLLMMMKNSKVRIFNNMMTVRKLINLVVFL